jgi:SAM-dependent methyltransferase
MPDLAELYIASDSDPAHIVEFLRALAAAYELPQPLHVLDAGCGPGRLLAPLTASAGGSPEWSPTPTSSPARAPSPSRAAA